MGLFGDSGCRGKKEELCGDKEGRVYKKRRWGEISNCFCKYAIGTLYSD